MSDKTIQEILIGIGESVPAEEWARPAITHYADPDTLATLAKLERENAALRHDVERHVKIASDLATELEAARKDAERYRWLRDLSLARKKMSVYVGQTFYIGDVACNRFLHGKEMDAAIDAAIAQGKGEK